MPLKKNQYLFCVLFCGVFFDMLLKKYEKRNGCNSFNKDFWQ